jgi:putative peptidoglycan lipid II flippase
MRSSLRPGVMLRATQIVTILGLISQIAAFLRTAIIAYMFGIALEVDAYNLAIIPVTVISVALASWLQISFVGRYAASIARGDKPLSDAYRSQMLVLVIGCATVAATGCYCFAPLITDALVSSDSAELAYRVLRAMQVAGLALVPIVAGDFAGLVLNCHGRFGLAALAPVANASVSISGLLLWPHPSLSALVITLLLGNIAQGAVVFIGLARLSLPFRFRSSLAWNAVLRSASLALPLLPAMLLANSSIALIASHCSQFGEGTVAIYGYASRLHGAVTQVMIMGLGTVLLPHFATQWSVGLTNEIVILLRKLARMGAFFSISICLAIYAMGDDVIVLLLARGAFSEQYAFQVNSLWALLSLSLYPLAAGTIIAKFCQALHGVGPILLSGAVSFIVTWLCATLGSETGSLDIVVSSATASAVAGLLFWLTWLSRKLPIGLILKDMLIAYARALLIWLPAFGCVHLFAFLFPPTLSPIIHMILEGTVYLSIALLTMFGTKSYSWYFQQPFVKH